MTQVLIEKTGRGPESWGGGLKEALPCLGFGSSFQNEGIKLNRKATYLRATFSSEALHFYHLSLSAQVAYFLHSENSKNNTIFRGHSICRQS